MKKTTRRILSLALVMCLVMAMAISASAATYNYSGTYNTVGYGVSDECNKYDVYISMGSTSSTHTLFVYADYYHKEGLVSTKLDSFETERGLYSVENDDIYTAFSISYMVAKHYMNNACVHTATVNA